MLLGNGVDVYYESNDMLHVIFVYILLRRRHGLVRGPHTIGQFAADRAPREAETLVLPARRRGQNEPLDLVR
jgi:hypothetical protein